MTRGFQNPEDFAAVIGWELYQVTIDKFHVMFFFENGWQLLNVAYGFSHRSADQSINYSYELYGSNKRLELDRLLRRRVIGVEIPSSDRLALVFDNDDQLIVHDDPQTQSWWFIPVSDPEHPEKAWAWSLSDDYVD